MGLNVEYDQYVYLERIMTALNKDIGMDKPDHVFKIRHEDEGLSIVHAFSYESADIAREHINEVVHKYPIDAYGISYYPVIHDILFKYQKVQTSDSDTDDYRVYLVDMRTDKGEPYVIAFNEESSVLAPFEIQRSNEFFGNKKFKPLHRTVVSERLYNSLFRDKRKVEGKN